MKRLYTIEDIKEMLESKGYEWNGYFYDNEKHHARPLTNEDLDRYEMLELSTKHNDVKMLRYFKVNYFEFITGHGLSQDAIWNEDWQKQLLDKYPQYTQMLINHADENIKDLNTRLINETQNLISKLTRLKQYTDAEKEKCEQMKKLATEQQKKNMAKREKYDVDYIRPYLTEDIEE